MAGSASPIATSPFPPERLSNGMNARLSTSSGHILLSTISSGTPRNSSSYASTIECSSNSQEHGRPSSTVDAWLSRVEEARHGDTNGFWANRSSSSLVASSPSSQDIDALLGSQSPKAHLIKDPTGKLHSDSSQEISSLDTWIHPTITTVNDAPSYQPADDHHTQRQASYNQFLSDSDDPLFSDLDTQPYNVTDLEGGEEPLCRKSYQEREDSPSTTDIGPTSPCNTPSLSTRLSSAVSGCHPLSSTHSSVYRASSDQKTGTLSEENEDDEDDTQPYSVGAPLDDDDDDPQTHPQETIALQGTNKQCKVSPKTYQDKVEVDSQEQYSSQEDILDMLRNDYSEARRSTSSSGAYRSIGIIKSFSQILPRSKSEPFIRRAKLRNKRNGTTQHDTKRPQSEAIRKNDDSDHRLLLSLSSQNPVMKLDQTTKEQTVGGLVTNQDIKESQQSNTSQQSFLSNSSEQNLPAERWKGFGRVVKSRSSQESRGSVTKASSTTEINTLHNLKKSLHRRRPTIGISKRSIKPQAHHSTADHTMKHADDIEQLTMKTRKSYGMRSKRP